MTPALVQAIRALKLARITEQEGLHRHAPKTAKAIDELLRITKASTR